MNPTKSQTLAALAEYEKHKEDPLVVFLVNHYYTKSSTAIPKVWEDFIKKSTPETDLSILLSQVHLWGVTSPFDLELRGEDLLREIQRQQLAPHLVRATTLEKNSKVGWPKALESTFIRHRILERLDAQKLRSEGSLKVTGDIEYVETGTLRYSICRRIPNIEALVPPDWILANCGPEVSDADLVLRFLGAQAEGFAPPTLVQGKGFALREYWKKVFGRTHSDVWDPDKLTSSLSGVFPKEVRIAKWSDEPLRSLRLSDPRRSAMKVDADVGERNVRFSFGRNRHGNPRISGISFPEFTIEERNEAMRKGTTLPGEYTVSRTDRFANLERDPESDENAHMKDALVATLRGAYDELKYNAECYKMRTELEK